MSKRKVILHRRKFIDKIENSDSYIKSDISSWGEDRAVSLDAELNLADCYKKITWGFSVYATTEAQRKKEIKEVRAKIRNVQKMFDEFFSTLEEEFRKMEDTPWPTKEEE